MTKVVVVHSRKGGVGKTTVATELAWLLDAVLVDLDWEAGCATRAWGYRWEDRLKSPVLTAIEAGRTPKPLKGHRKPRLVPSHPDFEHSLPDASEMSELLLQWAGEWDTDWVVVDTHPGANDGTNGALAVANVVVSPVVLADKDLSATEALVGELADYPVVLIPNKVPKFPPRKAIGRLREMVSGTPVQVGPLIPISSAVGDRTKRMSITSEDPPAKRLQPVAEALVKVAEFVKEYAND